MSKAIGMFFYLNPVLNSLVGQFNTYPKLTSGSADSCNGFTFPGCPEWFVSSDGASYHSNVTVALEEEENWSSIIYTAIAGWHTPYTSEDLL